MYKVTILNDGEETTIHDPNVNDLKLESGSIKTEINMIDSFTLSFLLNNPAYGNMRTLKTLVKVFNTKTGEYEFEGRVLSPTDSMAADGMFNTSYLCEGELGYLHDSQQQHREFRGTPRQLLEDIISYHNSQVEQYKRFTVGEMDVTNSTNNIYLYLSAEDDTFDAIKDKLLDNIGGELQIRKVDGVRYLDYLQQIGEPKNTEIRIAKNLMSMSREVDPTEIITRLTPLGTRIESEDEEATDASEARLTIESVNGGLSYLDDAALIAEFGIQGGSITWDDITIASNLMTAGQNWLSNQKTARVQYTLGALDLFLIGLDIDTFKKGNSYPLINPVMGIDDRLRIVGKTTDINNPQDASLNIGEKFKTLNEYQNESNKSTEKVVDLERVVSKQNQTIGTIRNELNTVKDSVQQVEITLSESDIPALEAAVDSLNEALDGLLEAIDSIPVYDPVTATTDGLMIASDKVKLDSLQNYTNATEVQAGLMSGDDKAKSNRMTITAPVNVDELVNTVADLLARVEELENDGA